MPGDPLPIAGAILDGQQVQKSTVRGVLSGDYPHRIANADVLRSLDGDLAWLIFIEGVAYTKDTSDTTTPDNGLACIHDASGNLWKRKPTLLQGTGSFNPRGEYSAGATYELLDLITQQNSSWVYLNATPGSGNPPPTLPTVVNAHWQLVAYLSVQTVLDTLGVHAITISTSDPSGGVDGDLWFKVPV